MPPPAASGTAVPPSGRRPLPPGVDVVPDFVTEAEEELLLATLDAAAPFQTLATRRVAHFTSGFDYASRGTVATPAPPPPPPLAALLGRVVAAAGLPSADQVTINDYIAGAGLPRHVDTHSPFGDVLAAVSLGAGAPLELTRPDDRPGGPRVAAKRSLWLPPRSLLILSGEARLGWEHRIKADVRRGRRVSITVRSARQPPACSCAFPALCDSQGGGPGTTRDATAAAAAAAALTAATDASLADAAALAAAAGARGGAVLEAALVRAVYDRIAGHFDATRTAVWPQVAAFARAAGEKALIADVGCGNGKYRALAGFSMGLDPCPGLLAAAAARPSLGDAVLAAGPGLPLRRGLFDAALCIAVVHHLASRPRRRALIESVVSLLRPGGGRALVTAWAAPDAQPAGKDADRAARWRPLGGRGDFLVPWHERKEGDTTPSVVWRFYHCYEGAELREDGDAAAARVEGARVERVFLDRGNWCVVVRRE